MKISKSFFQHMYALLISFVLLGCTFPVTESDDIEVYFRGPSNGDVMMVGETFEVLANGFSTAGEVSRVLYFANGRLIGNETNLAGETISVIHLWSPEEPGEYTLQLAAQRWGEYAYSETITVCVLPFQIAPGHPSFIYAHGYEGDCIIPERSGSSGIGAPTLVEANASPDTLTYVPTIYYEESCRDETRYVNFKISINDPADDIVFATIAINMNPAYFGRINGETTLALTHTANGLPSIKIFAGRMNLHIYLERSLSIPETGEGENGELEWSARGFSRSGEILLEAGPFIIPVTPVSCDGSLPITPTSTSALSATTSEPTFISTSSKPSTFTLARDAVCRAGPSLDYKIAEYISNGISVPVQARNAEANWLVVLLQNRVRCWVSLQLGTLDGDPNLLPIEDAPEIIPTPTQTSGGQQGENPVDADNDGYNSDVDCNDNSDKIYPGAPEIQGDQIDSNCNGFDSN